MPIALYCSTGAIIGRVNQYDYRHILRVMPELFANSLLDGIELMMLPAYLDKLPQMAREFAAAELHFTIIPADKEVGTLLSHGAAAGADGEGICREALDLWKHSCLMGELIGASQIVLHLWGGLDSDAHLEGNLAHLENLRRRAAQHGLEVLIENVPCTTADPAANLSRIHAAFPDQRFVFDTRFAAFHHQSETLFDCPWLIGDRLAHLHISDLRDGPQRDFSRLRPILHPGEGKIDFPSLFSRLRAAGYGESATLESPVMSPEGIDIARLKCSLLYLHDLC